MPELRETVLAILANTDAHSKVSQLFNLFDEHLAECVVINLSGNHESEDLFLPGRPAKPELVVPKFVPKRKMDTVEGRAILWHFLAHVDFNAMNLAVDAIWRFTNMPKAYYGVGVETQT
jgi:uncharacterized ferritin-like protein (DUF455 family)